MRNAAIGGSAAGTGMPFARTNRIPAAASAAQPITNAARKLPGQLFIALILASVIFVPCLTAQEPPANLAKLTAHRETETETERNEYTYRQTVTLDELDGSGGIRGGYHE